MSKNKFKAKLKRNMAEGLLQVICTIIQEEKPSTDDDKMFLAVLDEMRIKIDMKLVSSIQKDYQFSFSLPQAFALRILHTDYVLDRTSYIGNKLRTMANEVHQQYC